MNSIEKFQDRFHGKIKWSDSRSMTEKEKDAWLDQKISSGFPGVWWTERWGSYFVKFKGKLLGEFGTKDQAIKALTKIVERECPKNRCERIRRLIQAYEDFRRMQSKMRKNATTLDRTCGANMIAPTSEKRRNKF